MTTFPIYWAFKTRGFWDHGFLMRAAADTLWPTCYAVKHEEWEQDASFVPPTGAGAILVLSARFLCDKVPAVQAILDKLAWAQVHIASDEEGIFPWRELKHPRMSIWVQTAHPETHDEVTHRYVTGPRIDTQDIVRTLKREPKLLLWAYSGQAQNPLRQQCVTVLQDRNEKARDGFLQITNGFGQGFPYPEYLQMLTDVKLTPCPPGSFTTDCFRIYESLECGALPVATARSPINAKGFDYWTWNQSGAPFPRLNDWNEFNPMADDYASNPVKLQHHTNLAVAWWLQYKRDFSYRLQEDASRLSGEPLDYRQRTTILMPTSPIPSHPSTALLDDTIKRIRAYDHWRDTEIILMIDGVRPEQEHRKADYVEYTKRVLDKCRLDPDYRNVLPLAFKDHVHQANMTKRAMELVRTPLVMFVEHDTYPMGEVPWREIEKFVEGREDIHCCRLNIFDKILEEHQYLMFDKEPVVLGGLPVVRTKQWSQRPHIAKSALYRTFLTQHFAKGAKTMIEDPLYGIALENPEPFGMCIYTPPGSQLRSGHNNGREGDPKYEMEHI